MLDMHMLYIRIYIYIHMCNTLKVPKRRLLRAIPTLEPSMPIVKPSEPIPNNALQPHATSASAKLQKLLQEGSLKAQALIGSLQGALQHTPSESWAPNGYLRALEGHESLIPNRGYSLPQL